MHLAPTMPQDVNVTGCQCHRMRGFSLKSHACPQEFKLWLTRIPNTEPIMKTDRFERGSYLVFDTATWDAVRKDNFVVRA